MTTEEKTVIDELLDYLHEKTIKGDKVAEVLIERLYEDFQK